MAIPPNFKANYENYLKNELHKLFPDHELEIIKHTESIELEQSQIRISSINEKQVQETLANTNFHFIKRAKGDVIIRFTGDDTYPAQAIKQYNLLNTLEQLEEKRDALYIYVDEGYLDARKLNEDIEHIEAQIKGIEQELYKPQAIN
jgi:hypothetical protein